MSFSKEKFTKDNYDLVESFHADSHNCKNPTHYENYLRFNALLDSDTGMGITNIYIDTNELSGERKIMGYMTLRFSSYIKDMGESKKYGFSALEISELAVNEIYVGRGVGTDMVLDAINIANEINKEISIKYIVLCADPSAESFYTRSKLSFQKMISFSDEIPREHSNISCIPMFLRLR